MPRQGRSSNAPVLLTLPKAATFGRHHWQQLTWVQGLRLSLLGRCQAVLLIRLQAVANGPQVAAEVLQGDLHA
jgi:hypothetical protein